MTAFPEVSSIPYIAPVKLEHEWKTLIHSYEGGAEVRKQKYLFPRRHVTVNYEHLTLEDAHTLWDFYNSQKGRYGHFNFFVHTKTLYIPTYTGEYVGLGDGITIVFNLPSRNASDYTLYVDGVEAEEDVAWAFSQGGGTDGADKATFASAPTSGKYITMDFTGTLKIHGRFADDLVSFDVFFAMLASGNLKIQGLLNQ